MRSHHWLRQWLDAEQATSRYLNQWWPGPTMHIYGTRGRWVTCIYWYRTADCIHAKYTLYLTKSLKAARNTMWCITRSTQSNTNYMYLGNDWFQFCKTIVKSLDIIWNYMVLFIHTRCFDIMIDPTFLNAKYNIFFKVRLIYSLALEYCVKQWPQLFRKKEIY